MLDLVSGTCANGFEAVVGAFDDHLRSAPRGGAALAVYHRGELVVDAWGGLADAQAGTTWQEDTAVVLYSCSKSVAAIVVLRLVEQGLLDLDAPVALYWPEFARHGKEAVTLRQVMSHRAGVPLVDASLTREQVLAGGPLAEALADQVPLWEPGTAHAYHALTVGAVLGEIVRRVTGRSLGRVLRDDLATPLDLDLWIGLPADEHERVAVIERPDLVGVTEHMSELVRAMLAEDDRAWRAVTLNGTIPIPLLGVSDDNAYNLPEVRSAELPAGNAIATARSLAKLHAALIGPVADGGPVGAALLAAETLDDAIRPQTEGAPALGPLIPPYPVWGTGFMLPWEHRPMLGPSAFGHDGAAGGLCFADRESEVAFAFLPSVMGAAPDLRANAIVTELRRCLDARRDGV